MMTKLNCEELIPVTKGQLISSLLKEEMVRESETKRIRGTIHLEGLCIVSPKADVDEDSTEYKYATIDHAKYDYEYKLERIMSNKLEVRKANHKGYTTYKNFNGYVLSLNELLPDRENNSINTNPDIKLYLSDLGIVINQYSNGHYHEDMNSYMYLDSIDYEIKEECNNGSKEKTSIRECTTDSDYITDSKRSVV